MGNKGLYRKYIIQKADGTEIDKNADYFVLRLDTDKAAREAILYYAMLIERENRELAYDLLMKYGGGTKMVEIDKTEGRQDPRPNIYYYETVVNELKDVYKKKNHDYGDSFAILYKKFGLQSVVIRLWDKLLRLETLTKEDAEVKNESIQDTLKDMANYCIMTLAEMKKGE